MYDKTKFRRVYIEAETTRGVRSGMVLRGGKASGKFVTVVRTLGHQMIRTEHTFEDGTEFLEQQIRLSVEDFAEQFRRDFNLVFARG